ncbi:hypothetical protein GCM10009747_09640 [Agromyces humatus]|uniref:Uncharacterized protein n=1 Tax=Agromyces humatus TaxID=279573 RepID=A0ABN2KE83_9MICO
MTKKANTSAITATKFRHANSINMASQTGTVLAVAPDARYATPLATVNKVKVAESGHSGPLHCRAEGPRSMRIVLPATELTHACLRYRLVSTVELS